MIEKYRTLPEWVRLVLTAVIGASIGLLTYEIIYWLMPVNPRATISWGTAYLIGIARQHALHRYLTYHHHDSPYWPSLGRAYVMYSGAFALGVLLDHGLTQYLGLHHRTAWFICLGVTALVSFVFLKRFVFKVVDPRKAN